MTDRDRLIEILQNRTKDPCHLNGLYEWADDIADYLIANGVIVPPCKPIPLLKDKNPLNSDVYCPTCGTNLSGYYGDEPLSVIQCFNCGELLDNTKSITSEEAEKALEGYKEN